MSAYDWNPSDKDSGITLSESNARAAASAGSWVGVRSVFSFDVGSSLGRYVEFEAVSVTDYCMVGIAEAGLAFSGLFNEATSAFHYNLGTIYPSTGAFGSTWTTGDIVMMAFRNGKVYFGLNGTWFNSADFVAETGYSHTGLTGVRYLAMACYATDIRLLPTAASQSYAAPTGFIPVTNPVTLTRTLLDAASSPLASDPFDWALFSEVTADTLTAPIATGSDTTDGSGNLDVVVGNLQKASGDVCSLLISNTAGSHTAQCRSHFAPIEIP